MTADAALPAAREGSRIPAAASWLFVLPLLAEGILPAVVKIEVAGLEALAFAWVVVQERVLPHRALERIFAVFAVLSLTVLGYVAFGSWPVQAGAVAAYDAKAALFVAAYTAVAVFAVLFLYAELLQQVIWRGATLALWVAVICCVASRLSGYLILVNPSSSGLRMVGTLTEPSDWAPLLAMVMLMALHRRDWLYVALSLGGLALADSPICLLVMAVTVPLWFALCGTWKYRVPLLITLAVIIPAGAAFVARADTAPWLASGNGTEVAVGRLVSGIRNVETGGQQGSNDRYASVTDVLTAVRDNGWVHTGAGPAADATWFPAEYPASLGAPQAANALWLSVLFDYGEQGLAVLAVLMLAAIWRMRRDPAMCAVLLPFFIASLVNSTIPDYSLVALGIMLYAFGGVRGVLRSAGTGRTRTRA